MSSIPAYALFGTLYRDIFQQSPTFSNAKSAFLNKLPNTIIKEDGGDRIWGYNFEHTDKPAKEDEICNPSGISIDQKQLLKILQGGYANLKRMYLSHLQNVLKFLNTVFIIDRDFTDILKMPGGFQTRAPILRLHPRFARDNSVTELNKAMVEARRLLELHYVEVELEYGKTLSALKMARSIAASPASTATNTSTGAATATAATGGGSKYKHATRRMRNNRNKPNKRYISLRKKRVARR